jgi:basic amino acid/polyamine antiporter, APA family
MLLGQSRVFYSMSNDGLLPKVFSVLHPKFRTPYKSNILLFIFVGLIATLLPGDITGDLTSIGTLLAFTLVCIGIIIMRKKDPDHPRPFRTPLVPLVPILGALLCLAMIVSLDKSTILVALAWMVVGLMIYFSYSKKNSKLNG